MARIAPEEVGALTQRPVAGQGIHGGRPITAYLFIELEGYGVDTDLAFWIEQCLAFNLRAKSNKKK